MNYIQWQNLKKIEENTEKKKQYEFTKNVKEALKSRGDKLKAMTEFQKENETRMKGFAERSR